MPSAKSPEERGYMAVRLKEEAVKTLDAYCAKHKLTRSQAVLTLGLPLAPDKTPEKPALSCHTPSWQNLYQIMRSDMCARVFIEKVKYYWDLAMRE